MERSHDGPTGSVPDAEEHVGNAVRTGIIIPGPAAARHSAHAKRNPPRDMTAEQVK